MHLPSQAFWSYKTTQVFEALHSSLQGLAEKEARKRLKIYGHNLLKTKKLTNWWVLLLSQFKSPLVLLLIAAALLSFFLKNSTDALIIMIIVAASAILRFFQEKGAVDAIEKLLQLVQIKAVVLLEGKKVEVSVECVVPGDIIFLGAGDIIPGDALIIESNLVGYWSLD